MKKQLFVILAGLFFANCSTLAPMFMKAKTGEYSYRFPESEGFRTLA